MATTFKRCVCIHGHFYQPPRENPWLEAVERQPSAAPSHDWNERVNRECYAPNTRSRILDSHGRILSLQNNYEHISFNIGPTLLNWIRENDRPTYEAIIEADQASSERLGGHGNAIAQCYNHMIMPLASARDKATQTRWGIADFQYHYGRKPEGMWLPETAADTESLAALAAEGIRFTVLSPYQARRVRPLKERSVTLGKTGAKPLGEDEGWTDASGGKIDTKQPYLFRLPNGKTITLFFYDGPLSRAVAFEDLLYDGVRFAERLKSAGFSAKPAGHELSHIATDGESYGHHWQFGDMALARAIDTLRNDKTVELLNYGAFLDLQPPVMEVQLFEPSAWSCSHGVGRWKENCGCNSGGSPAKWNQKWRKGLRDSLDALRDTLDAFYEKRAGALWNDPWAAREGYIRLVLDRDAPAREAFLQDFPVRESADDGDAINMALRLLEMQRQRMLMFTSCGWFFDEVTGLEPLQNLKYAARALQLAESLGGNFVDAFHRSLHVIESNLSEEGDGCQIYDHHIRPETVELGRVAANVGMRLAQTDPADPRSAGLNDYYCYDVAVKEFQRVENNGLQLCHGLLSITSRITFDQLEAAFAVLQRPDEHMKCLVQPEREGEGYAEFSVKVRDAFAAKSADALREIPLGASFFSSKMLFHDAFREFMERVARKSMEGLLEFCRQNFENYNPLMEELRQTNSELPPEFKMAARLVLEQRLEDALIQTRPAQGFDDAERILAEIEHWGLEAPEPLMRKQLNVKLQQAMDRMEAREFDSAIPEIAATLQWARGRKVKIDLIPLQDRLLMLLEERRSAWRLWVDSRDSVLRQRAQDLAELGASLNISEILLIRPAKAGD
ncbi:DUF3536 domain-containing protein [Candidatus Sumerlaeota bacterium]|nr:DUF3536 domain-containing protein [Candidatus Sumerlaeota bacterium]